MLRPADWFILGVFAAVVALGLTACATPPAEPNLCSISQKYPATQDPIVASMFGLPTQGCR